MLATEDRIYLKVLPLKGIKEAAKEIHLSVDDEAGRGSLRSARFSGRPIEKSLAD